MSPHGGFFLEHDLIRNRVFDKFTGDVGWSSSASVLELFGSCFYLVRRDLGTVKGLGGPSKGSKGGTVLSAVNFFWKYSFSAAALPVSVPIMLQSLS